MPKAVDEALLQLLDLAMDLRSPCLSQRDNALGDRLEQIAADIETECSRAVELEDELHDLAREHAAMGIELDTAYAEQRDCKGKLERANEKLRRVCDLLERDSMSSNPRSAKELKDALHNALQWH